MKHNRLLSIFSFLLLFTTQFAVAGEFGDMIEDAGISAEKDLVEGVDEDVSESFQKAIDDLAKGDSTAMEDFIKDNPDALKNTQDFTQKIDGIVAKQQEALAEAAKATDAADQALAGESQALTKDGLLGHKDDPDFYKNDPQAARVKYREVIRTKNLVEKTKSALSKTFPDIKNTLEEYATRMKNADRDITGVANQYRVDLTNIPQNALDTLGVKAQKVAGLKAMLESSDRAQIEAACKEVAKLKALSRVGDIDNIIGRFAKAGTGVSRDMADQMVADMIKNVKKSFDNLDKKMSEDPSFFDETTTTEGGTAAKDAKGMQQEPSVKEIKTSPFQQFLDETTKDLETDLKKQTNTYISQCDLAGNKLAADGGIETLERMDLRARTYFRNPRDVIAEKYDAFATKLKTTSRYDLADKASEVVEGAGNGLKELGKKIEGVAEMLVSAVVFMVPNIFQSTFLAQQDKAAAMASWGNPIKYGGKVYQIPDSCINLDSPTSSWPIYAQIPVANIGDSISSGVSKLFDGSISGPTTNNALSNAIHSATSEIFSFGATTDTTISRYKMEEGKFLPLTDLVVVYGGPGAYVTPGSVAMNSSQFTGQIISLRTGMVSDATGDMVDATGLPPSKNVPLITQAQWGGLTPPQTSPASQGLESVQQFLPSILSKTEIDGSKVTYTQYSNVTSGSKGLAVTQLIQDLLDTDCVSSKGYLTQDACQCVIVDGLESLAAGLNINSSGDVSTVFHVDTATPQQFLKVKQNTTPVIQSTGTGLTPAKGQSIASGNLTTGSAVTSGKNKILGRLSSSLGSTARTKSSAVTPPASTGWKGLGAVLPIFGWGTKDIYNSIFSATAFPGYDPSSAEIAGIASVGNIGADNMVVAGKGATGEQSTVFASEDEVWAAKGCWIYLSTNTPFAQYIQQGVTTPQSLTGPYVDYIVFLDSTATNIVPLMVPVTVDVEIGNDGSSYKKTQMYLNPDIKFWTSLIAYNLPEFVETDPTTGQLAPIMYGLFDNNVYPYAGLGALAGAATAQESQGPTGIIPTFISAIETGYPQISQQFQLHSSALIYRIGNMPIPYANCALTTSNAYDLTIGKTTTTTYTGLKCFESSIEGDYLIPVDSYTPASGSSDNPSIGNVQTLPSEDAQYLISLVTDIVYKLEDNAWVPFDFTNSMLNLDSNDEPVKSATGLYEVNTSLESEFYFMSGFFSTVTPPASFVADLTAKRTAWLKNMGVSAQIGSGSSAITCTLAAGITQLGAKTSGSYIYQLNPSPSAALVSQQDYFVAVDTAVPALDTLKPINILKAAAGNGTLVSLLTGTLYDMTGTPITYQNGLPKRIVIRSGAADKTSAQRIYTHITDTLFKKLPNEFTTAYQASVKAYSFEQAQPQGPYSFGPLQVAIRSADLANGTYVYFSAAGMHKSNFKPRDLYVILTPQVDPATGKIISQNLSQYDPTQTQYLLSLITGVAYDQNGQLAMALPAENLKEMIAGWSAGWSPWILDNLNTMQAAYAARLERWAADEERVKKELEEFTNAHDAALNKEKSEIAAIIARLEPSGSGLPIPFPELQYDATTEQYVHPSPAGADVDSGLIYLFLGSGKVYGQDGTYHTKYQPAHLKAVRDQLGVVVDPATQKQTLGIPMMQPSILLPEEDIDLTIGTSGESMIVSTDVNFPGGVVKMPAGYDLYFSKIMDTYYVFNSANLQWMSVDGGHIYEQDGAPVVVGNKVALANKDDLMLLYTNNNGYQQAFMSDGSEYSNLSSSNSTMNWMGLSAPYAEFQVSANSNLTEYKKGSKTYKVNDAYEWYSLVLVPIDDNGALLSEIPDSSYRFAQLVLNGKTPTNILYHGNMYKVVSVAANTYTMRPVNKKSGSKTISLTIDLVDRGTNAPYIEIVDGSDTYKYCYEPQSFDTQEQIANRVNIWRGATSASPLPLAVGPMHDQSQEIGGQTVTISVPDFITHTLFTRDLPSKNGVLNTLATVSAKSVVGAPLERQDSVGYGTLQLGLANVAETSDNRFVCSIGAWSGTPTAGVMTFPYVSKASYVDLQTGALFDAVSGIATGQCLNMKDLLTVLDTCAVMITNKTITYQEGTGKNKKTVTKNPKGKNIMVYRSSNIAQQQAATIESNSQVAAAGQGTVVVAPSQV